MAQDTKFHGGESWSTNKKKVIKTQGVEISFLRPRLIHSSSMFPRWRTNRWRWKREKEEEGGKKIFNKRENSRVMSWVMSLISNGDVAGSRKKFAPVKIRDRRTSIGIARARRKREIEMVSCGMFAALILLLSAVSVSCFRLGVDYGLSLFFWDTKRGEERLILPANDGRILNFSSNWKITVTNNSIVSWFCDVLVIFRSKD